MSYRKQILISLSIILFFFASSLVFAQEELPDTLWSKKLEDIRLVKFSPDGDYIYVSCIFGLIYNILKIESATGKTVDTIYATEAPCLQISFSPTGDTVVFVGGHQISFLDYETSELIDKIEIPEYQGIEGAITPDGKRIVINSDEFGFDVPQIIIYDIATKQRIKEFTGRYYYTTNLEISSDGKYLSFNDFRGTYVTVILINLNTYEEINIFGEENHNTYGNIGFSPDVRLIGINDYNKMYFWYLDSLRLFKSLTFFDTGDIIDLGVRDILYSSDSKYIIYSLFDYEDYDPNKIIVWDIEKDTIAYEYDLPGTQAIDISRDDYIAAGGLNLITMGEYLYLIRPKWNTTNVKDADENNDLIISYNNNNVKVRFPYSIVGIPQIKIYNLIGDLINSKSADEINISDNLMEFTVFDLTPGLYIFEINTSDKVYTFKQMIY